MLRSLVVTVAVVAACSHGEMRKMVAACKRTTGADPGACIAAANDRVMAKDDDGAKDFVEAAVDALDSSKTCLHDHEATGCFQTVVILLGEDPVGLLADFKVSDDLRVLAPKSDDDATNPRTRARTALLAMCGDAGGDAIERERACIVLGDLVEEEQAKRCGEGCDLATAKLGGWGKTEIIDGYAAACKIAGALQPSSRAKAFAESVSRLYAVKDAQPACGLAGSPMRGASVANAQVNMRRIRDDIHARQAALKKSDEREATRVAQMKQQAVEAQAKAKKEADAKAAHDLKVALDSANWAVAFELIKKRNSLSPVDEPSATALVHVWDSFVAWAIQQASPTSVYLEINEAFATLPANHPLPPLMVSLRDRALQDIKARAKATRGQGGAWLYAALAAKVAGRDSKEATAAFQAYETLESAVRVSVQYDKLSPTCAPLIKVTPGKKVKATSQLVCSIIPEKKWTAEEPMTIKQHVVKDTGEEDIEQTVQVEVTHRAFSVAVHGSVIVQGKTVPVEFEETLDDKEGTSTRTFAQAEAAAMAAIESAVVAPLEAGRAASEYTAAQSALRAQRQGAAEDHLVQNAVLVGSSPELDELLTPFGVTFNDLVQTSR